MMIQILTILALSFLQNVTFSMTSRARNRNSTSYHLITSIGSNTIWFLCFRELVKDNFGLSMLLPYIVGTAIGSIVGTKISMKIETFLDANADGHLKQN